MLIARIYRRNSSRDVRLDDISDKDIGFDGYMLEKEYAAKLSKLYLGAI
jgi:hypothetical protein